MKASLPQIALKLAKTKIYAKKSEIPLIQNRM